MKLYITDWQGYIFEAEAEEYKLWYDVHEGRHAGRYFKSRLNQDFYLSQRCAEVGVIDNVNRKIDLPPLNGTTSRAIIWWCQNQRRAFHATRKERTGRADHPQAASVEVEVGRGKTVAESVKKIGVTEQTYS